MNEQKIKFNGKMLEGDEKTLKELGIKQDSTVELNWQFFGFQLKDARTGTTSNLTQVLKQKITLAELLEHASTYSGVKSDDLNILIND